MSTPNHQMNPWLAGMIVAAGIAALLGIILLMNEPEPSFSSSDEYATQQLFGAGLLGLAAMLVVAWSVCCAITWTPEKSQLGLRPSPRPVDEDD